MINPLIIKIDIQVVGLVTEEKANSGHSLNSADMDGVRRQRREAVGACRTRLSQDYHYSTFCGLVVSCW